MSLFTTHVRNRIEAARADLHWSYKVKDAILADFRELFRKGYPDPEHLREIKDFVWAANSDRRWSHQTKKTLLMYLEKLLDGNREVDGE